MLVNIQLYNSYKTNNYEFKKVVGIDHCKETRAANTNPSKIYKI